MKKIFLLVALVGLFACTNPNDLDNGKDLETGLKNGNSATILGDSIENTQNVIAYCGFNGIWQRDMLEDDNITHTTEDYLFYKGHAFMTDSLNGVPMPLGDIYINNFKFWLSNDGNEYWIYQTQPQGFNFKYGELNTLKIEANEYFGGVDTTFRVFNYSKNLNIKYKDTISKSKDLTINWVKNNNPAKYVHLQLLINNFYAYSDWDKHFEYYGTGSSNRIINNGTYTFNKDKIASLKNGYYNLTFREYDRFLAKDANKKSISVSFEATYTVTVYITD